MNGKARHKTTVGTPEINSLAKRFNMTIFERVRCMLLSVGLNYYFWDDTIMTATYLVNRCSSIAWGMKITEEVWS